MKKGGFTLIELAIVVFLVAFLTLMGYLAYGKIQARSKLSRVSAELSDIANAVTQYAEDNNYQYPADVNRGVPPGLQKYLQGGVWPTSVWPHGVFDWDNWLINSQHVYQITYRLCDLDDPVQYCSDPVLFPNFQRNSSIFYCISGQCVPHQDTPTVPGYCVNCKVHEQNY